MRQPRILAVVSAVDLDYRYGCTPAWWQLWKGLYEADVDLIVTPYRGRAVESPWWRVEENPCYWEGESFDLARRAVARLRGDTLLRREEASPEDSVADRAVRETICRWVTPRWQRHLERILERERDVDAVVVFTVPPSHFTGIPTSLRERFGVPVVFYDADVPMSLPEFGGMDTGFNIYHGADISEYDLVLSNSEGGIPRLLELGARRAEAALLGRRPGAVRGRVPVEKQHDVFFYGYGDKFRRDWMEAMVARPSERLPDVEFALARRRLQGATLGRATELGDVPFNALVHRISSVARQPQHHRKPHASVPASSTCRIFELAVVRGRDRVQPVRGDRALVRAGARASSSCTPRTRPSRPTASCSPIRRPAEELGRNARERVLEEHTYAQRARQPARPRRREGRRRCLS